MCALGGLGVIIGGIFKQRGAYVKYHHSHIPYRLIRI